MGSAAMDIVRAGEIVAIMLAPSAAVAAVLYAPRGWRLARRLAVRVKPRRAAEPTTNPPIEQLALDLRRLLRQHDSLSRPDVAKRVGHLIAIEAAISDCATEAARALGVPTPERPARGGFPPADLRRLLLALAEAGLVLPPTARLFGVDRRS